ncbi:MAG: hypothetical protein ACPGVG_15360, partial [Mycobacterium sp.]
IVRGFDFIERHEVRKTYSRACVLLALTTRGEKADQKRIAELARERESIARDIFETQKRIGDIEREAARKRAAIEEQISAALHGLGRHCTELPRADRR